MRYLLESLKDLNDNLALHGGCLYLLQGNPIDVFKKIKTEIGLDLLTFEQVIEVYYSVHTKLNLIWF